MVKGVSRQVIVVRQPDTRLFEQAIFMLREEALGQKGVTDQQVLREACQVADQYVRSRMGSRHGKWRLQLKGWMYTALGAAATGAVWLATTLLI